MNRDTNLCRVDRDAVARTWRERGFSCGLWVDPPGQVWSDYVHDTDELVMVVEGDVEFEIDGKAHRPSPGEELLIPPALDIRSGTSARRVALTLRLPAMTTSTHAITPERRHTEPTS